MSKRVIIFVVGIMADLNANTEWARRYASKFESDTQSGVPFLYSSDPIGGAIWLEAQAAEMARLIKRYNHMGIRPDVVTHSHGAAIILRALSLSDVLISSLRMVAAAVKDDCELNGLNAAAVRTFGEDVQISEKITLLISPMDTVLATFGGMPGYGDLGLVGPNNYSGPLNRILRVEKFACGHSGYFDPENDARTYSIATQEAT